VVDAKAWRAEVRAWLEANCPASMRLPITPEEMVWGGSQLCFGSDDQRGWFECMRERGWFAPDWPSAYGGGGLSAKQARILEEEMLALGCRQPQFNLGVCDHLIDGVDPCRGGLGGTASRGGRWRK
jgi:alkylation response protein AidB-like acyl-CoA dehydrogenase